jgi:hypothetical protein
VQRVVDDRLDLLLGDRGLPPSALGHLPDALDPLGLEAGPPRQDAAAAHAGALGDLGVGDAVGRH